MLAKDKTRLRNSTIVVFYNPNMTQTIVQNEMLRVVVATPDFWEKEARLRRWLGIRVLVPVPLTLVVFLSIVYINRRHRKLEQRTKTVNVTMV